MDIEKDQQKNKAQKDQQKKNPKDKQEDLNDEDKILKEKIELWCQNICDQDQSLAKSALEQLIVEVKSATTSMTSVPKPFKFLKDHYKQMMDHYNQIQQSEFKKSFADFLSVLSMQFADAEQLMSLKLLLEGSLKDYKNWGHEYLHVLSSEIGKEYNSRLEKQQDYSQLLELVDNITPYFMTNNAEADAIDLLLEVDKLEDLPKFASLENFNRVHLYLINCANYSADQDEWKKTLGICYDICLQLGQLAQAMRIAIKLDKAELVQKVFDNCKDQIVRKQLAFLVARQRINLELEEELTGITSNQMLTSFYLQLAEDLEVLEPKHPSQIYKVHLEDKTSGNLDSALMNLASTYVNAFVNVGMGKDALMINKNESNDTPWIYKVKNEGLTAASASLGMVCLWDSEGGSRHINDYLELQEGYAKAGACIAIGLYNSGITDDCDPAKALLEEQINSKDPYSMLGAIIGIGLAYAGSCREDFIELLVPYIIDTGYNVEISAFASLSLGLIYVGKCNEDAGTAIIQTLMDRPESHLNMTVARYFGLALGLLFMSQQDACEPTLETLKLVEHPISKQIEKTVIGCAYLESGNVLKIQELMHDLVEQVDEKDQEYQAISVLSIALIAGSEEIGNEMILRQFNNILQYGEITVKRAIPLALAMLNLSNPKLQIQDLLTKLAHDQDSELSQRAILALGLIGCGTNNSRLAGVLRGLASYYGRNSSDSKHLFCVRIAQGFLHAGKGLVTIQPYYSDRFLLSKVAMAGILVVLNSCFDMSNIIHGKYHYVLYYLALALYPRMCFVLDDQLKNMKVNVRVGQALDIVGQAGQPKKITGFQTHTSPVILAYGERAELGTDEFIPYCQDVILENFVIIKKNPDYQDENEKPQAKGNVIL